MAQTPAVTRIAGFVLQVRDPERSARFYREGLGFRAEAHAGAGAVVSLGEVRLRLLAHLKKMKTGSGPVRGCAAHPPDWIEEWPGLTVPFRSRRASTSNTDSSCLFR